MSTYPSMQANGYDVGDAVTIHVSNSTSEQNKQKRNSILGISIISYALLILALDILIILNQSVCEPKGNVKNITEPTVVVVVGLKGTKQLRLYSAQT